jgi:hypothetical protein
MAIVQISRITQRKGLSENLPQLAGAEFGWVIDERRLFIGNGTIQEGAPAIGNTEILTEYSDIFAIAGLYTYKGEAGGYTVQTGPTSGDPVKRTLQSVLDETASVKDFGATGDGDTDDTVAINRALFQMFCRESNPQVRRSLFFPAGVYRVTNTINIPPFAKLYGEGGDSSVIFLNAATDSTFGPYVARTADSLQQTGVNIGNNGASPPQNVEIYNMGFQSNEEIDLVLVENAEQITFQDVSFNGPFSQSFIENNPGDVTTADIACVRFASTVSYITNTVTFDSCHYTGMTYAFEADQNIQGITVQNSKFNILYQGVLIGTNTDPGDTGPVGFRVLHNLFDNIAQEGIIIGSPTNSVGLNQTGYNIFLDVATNFQGGNQTPTSPIIDFRTNNNVSLGDMFERDETFNAIDPRIKINNKKVFALDNGERYKFGTYTRNAGDQVYLDLETTPTTVITIKTTEAQAFTMQYRFKDDLNLTNRFGTLEVVSQDGDDSAGTLSYTDDYTENNPTGLVLSVIQSGTNIYIQYTLGGVASGGTLKYSISYLG